MSPFILAGAIYANLTTATTIVAADGAGGTGVDLTNPLVWVTPVGVIVAMALGWLAPGPAYRRERDENDRKTKLFEEKVFPLAATYATSNKESADALNRSAEALESIKSSIDKNNELLEQVLPVLRRRRP